MSCLPSKAQNLSAREEPLLALELGLDFIDSALSFQIQRGGLARRRLDEDPHCPEAELSTEL